MPSNSISSALRAAGFSDEVAVRIAVKDLLSTNWSVTRIARFFNLTPAQVLTLAGCQPVDHWPRVH